MDSGFVNISASEYSNHWKNYLKILTTKKNTDDTEKKLFICIEL